MTHQRLAYDDAASPAEMSSDCMVVSSALHLPSQVSPEALPLVRSGSLAVSDATAELVGRFVD
jgi:hypothetical protein